MSEKSVERLLGIPEVVGFHCDDWDWSVGEIGAVVWKPRLRRHCVSAVKRLNEFLEMPYIEDVFGGDDRNRYVWRSRLSRRRGYVFDELNNATIFLSPN